jgi:hypothetical protein
LAWLLATCAVLLAALPAAAHRPGESYVYLITDDGPLRGEIDIRFSDLAKVFDLDADGDAIVSEAEVIAQKQGISDYLAARLLFHSEAGDHVPIPGDIEFFGPVGERQLKLFFAVPDLAPPPDTLGVTYAFLYDEIDPAHVPMLLFKSNENMRLGENEWVVSLVFGPGAERQEVSLIPLPAGETALRLAGVGLRQMLTSPYHALVALLALLPCLWARGPTGWSDPRAPADVITVALATAALFAVAFAAGIFVREFWVYRLTDWQSTWIVVAAGAVLLAHNLFPVPGVPRWLPVGLAGLLCGLSRSLYGY